MRHFEIMPRNPEVKGLEFQSSIYEPLGGCHNLICEVYTTAEAEYIKQRLNTPQIDEALASVLIERDRQEAKWGEQNHDPFTYLTVLIEEVGELAQAALHDRFGGSRASGLREEAVHTAAVALAIVQCLDRDKWLWPQAAGDYKQD